MSDPTREPFVFPASYFVVGYLLLMTAIAITLILLARRHGGELDSEEIKYKVFDDGIPDPRTEPEYRYERGRSTAAASGTRSAEQ